MSFEFKELEIKGVFLIKPHIFIDDRGIYKKTYYEPEFKKYGLPSFFSETSDIISSKGAIRGLHFQEKNSQAKLIHVIKGKLYDAIIDLRPNSESFGKHIELELNSDDNLVLFIPENFAHGFMALEDNTIFSYQCSGAYDPSLCGGLRWNDPYFNIDWPIKDINKLIITEKDKNWETFEEYKRKRGIL